MIDYVWEWLEYVIWLLTHSGGNVNDVMAHLFELFQGMKRLALI